MSADIGIVVGMAMFSGIFAYIALQMEDEAISYLAFVSALLFAIVDLALFADGATSTAAASMIYTMMSWVIWLLVVIIGYFGIKLLRRLVEWLTESHKPKDFDDEE